MNASRDQSTLSIYSYSSDEECQDTKEMKSQTPKIGRGSRIRKIVFFFMAIVFMALAAWALSFFLSSSKQQTSKSNDDMSTMEDKEFIPFIAYLQEEYGVQIELDSPAFKAMEWLVEEARYGSENEVQLSPKVVQQFALLSLFFTLNENFQDESSLPNWGMRNQNHCLWTGITCNELGHVTKIVMSEMNLKGTIASELGLLSSSLEHLDLSMNDIYGDIPEALYNLTHLQMIFLYKNTLSGTISTRLGNLQNITHFHISHNDLIGVIPEEIRDCRYLSTFNVYKNNLSGTIPRNLNLRRLKILDLGHNRIEGSIPSDIGTDYMSLNLLHLDHNRLTGTVPETIPGTGNHRLESLSIDNNFLNGTLPGNHQIKNKLGKSRNQFKLLLIILVENGLF